MTGSCFQQLGLHVKGCNEMAFHGVDAQDPAVEAENDLCQQLGRIILAVTSRRLRSCAVHTWYPLQVRQYPGRRPRHQHSERHARGRGALQSFEDVGRLPYGKKCCSEHSSQHVHTQQKYSIAKASEWKRSETLVNKITQQWSGGHTVQHHGKLHSRSSDRVR